MPNEDTSLLDHLAKPLTDGGHGFETGVPITTPENAPIFHTDDHRPGAWWSAALTHDHADQP